MKKIIACLLLIISFSAYANMVWPAVYLEARLFSWWAISAGLVIESIFVLKLFNLPAIKAFIATFCANFVSAVAGIILIPLSGIAWEIFPGSIFNELFNMGTFNPITWSATFIIACMINVAIEGGVYQKLFKLPFKYKSKTFFWFLIANAFSVGVALISVFINPLKL